jgi:hypothetical protein
MKAFSLFALLNFLESRLSPSNVGSHRLSVSMNCNEGGSGDLYSLRTSCILGK